MSQAEIPAHHAQKQRLFDNIAAAMQGVPERRQFAHFSKADPAYGAGVARALKLDPVGDDGSRAPARRTSRPKSRSPEFPGTNAVTPPPRSSRGVSVPPINPHGC